MVILIVTVVLYLLYLVYERLVLNRQINTIPLRIGVTGTRGKSSVTRLLASVLRQDGRCVLAKTTGSQPKIILPDGEEVDVPRRGIPSIIEQKRIVKKAVDIKADCIVIEIMSIHGENHTIESQQILQPNIVVMTNIRSDHIDAMGKTEDEIGSILCLDIPEKAVVFVPEKECRPCVRRAVQNAGGSLIKVRERISAPLNQMDSGLYRKEFTDNVDLVYSLANHLNIREEVVLDGIRKGKQDVGAFKIWKYQSQDVQKTVYFVNGFAANDPVSTTQVIEKVKEVLPEASDRLIGLLNLRPDRGDRTLQWIDSLRNRSFGTFESIYVTGAHAKVVKRKLKSPRILRQKLPEKIMKTILKDIGDHAVIFGFGNMRGMGYLLVDYWNEVGEAYGV